MLIFRRIFLSNYWWQESDIWSQASYMYAILWEAFVDPSDSYFLFAVLVGFIHIEHICTLFVTFFSATIDDTNLIFGHKLHIGTPYRGKHFWTHQIPTSCLPTLLIFIHIEHMLIFRGIFLNKYWWQRSDIWSQASYRYPILWEAFFDPSDSYFLFAVERGFHKWALAHSSSCLNFFSSPDPKGQVSYSHHLASVVVVRRTS